VVFVLLRPDGYSLVTVPGPIWPLLPAII
jgi:hypothetical protein